MKTEHNIGLSSAELAGLWSTYMGDSSAICLFKHFLRQIKDSQIQPILEYALHLSNNHISRITSIFKEENCPIPKGFTDEDVNLDAPRLFSDPFYLFYIKEMGRLGMANYTISLANSTRFDVIDFFSEALDSSKELHNQATVLLLEKGLMIKPPYIPMPEKIDFVKRQNILTGWLGERRTLNVVEISHLYSNIIRNLHGKSVLIGFSQTAKTKEVSDWMMRGKEIADKNIEIFGSLLSEDDLPAPMTWDTEVTASTVPAFSDKLMMFQVQSTNGIGMMDYGTSVGMSLRRDLGTHYMRLAAETLQYAEDGMNIMIKHGWLEQTPQMVDRHALANSKKA